MIIILICSLIVNAVLSSYVAATAEKKEIGYNTTFWLSFFFSPLIGLLFSIASPEIKDDRELPDRWYSYLLEIYNRRRKYIFFLLIVTICLVIVSKLKERQQMEDLKKRIEDLKSELPERQEWLIQEREVRKKRIEDLKSELP